MTESNVNQATAITVQSAAASSPEVVSKTSSSKQSIVREESSSSSSSSSVSARMLSSAFGSIVTAFVVTPLDVVKVRQQAAASPNKQPASVTPCPKGCGTFVLNNGLMECTLPKSCASFFDPKTGQMKPRAAQLQRTMNVTSGGGVGTFAMVRKIFAREGFAGIYAGLTPTLLMAVPSTVLYFTAYDEISHRLKQHYHHPHGSSSSQGNVSSSLSSSSSSDMWIPLVGGSTSRFFTTAVTAPLELIRTRQASRVGQAEPPPGLLHELRHLVRSQGVMSLYQGLAPTLWRDVPFSAIYWFTVEHVKSLFQSYDARHHHDLGAGDGAVTHAQAAGRAFVGGALGGIMAAACTTPFDVVKTRQQVMVGQVVQQAEVLMTTAEGAAAALCDHNGAIAATTTTTTTTRGGSSSSTLGMMRYIVQTEGIKGLWRGNVTRMYKVVPACAIMISCYDLGKKMLE